jgi:hypothetical protein
VSDAYFSIPVFLIWLACKRGDLPFSWVFLMLALFILSCGATHIGRLHVSRRYVKGSHARVVLFSAPGSYSARHDVPVRQVVGAVSGV